MYLQTLSFKLVGDSERPAEVTRNYSWYLAARAFETSFGFRAYHYGLLDLKGTLIYP